MNLNTTKYPNNIRTVSGTPTVFADDVVLNCDTSGAPVVINLNSITPSYWLTTWRLYIVDISNNASVNNITINAGVNSNGVAQTINSLSSLVLNKNGEGAMIEILNDTSFVATISSGVASGTVVTGGNTDTIQVISTPISNGYNITANSILNEYLLAVKSLTNSNTSYCQRTNQLEPFKYDSPFQSLTDGTIFGNFDSKSGAGQSVANFDLPTGIFTIPSSGWYYMQMQIGYILNSGSPASFYSDNSNTLWSPWVVNAPSITNGTPVQNRIYTITQYNAGDNFTGASYHVVSGTMNTTGCVFIANGSTPSWANGSVLTPTYGNTGSFQLGLYLMGSGFLDVARKELSQNTGALYLYGNVLAKFSQGQEVEIVYTNNSDLEMFGQPYSSLIFKSTKISN